MYVMGVCVYVCSLAAHIFGETQSALIILFGIDFTWLVGSYGGFLFLFGDEVVVLTCMDGPNILW